MQNWQHFSEPEFALGFQYPLITPQGHTVEKAERRKADAIRIHFTSKGSREVYFEISKFHRLSPSVEYQQHKEILEKRAEGFVVSELKEIHWLSQSAYEYSLKWGQGRRIVRLIQVENELYRFLYDPKSPLNARILLTIQWTY